MSRLQVQLGCIRCGKPRKRANILSQIYAVYFQDRNTKSLVKVDYCKTCFDDLAVVSPVHADIRNNLHASEVLANERRGRPQSVADRFAAMEFEAHISVRTYWGLRQHERTGHYYIDP